MVKPPSSSQPSPHWKSSSYSARRSIGNFTLIFIYQNCVCTIGTSQVDAFSLNLRRPTCSRYVPCVLNDYALAAAAYSGRTEFCENADAAAP